MRSIEEVKKEIIGDLKEIKEIYRRVGIASKAKEIDFLLERLN